VTLGAWIFFVASAFHVHDLDELSLVKAAYRTGPTSISFDYLGDSTSNRGDFRIATFNMNAFPVMRRRNRTIV